jgi:hypothetical protein
MNGRQILRGFPVAAAPAAIRQVAGKTERKKKKNMAYGLLTINELSLLLPGAAS